MGPIDLEHTGGFDVYSLIIHSIYGMSQHPSSSESKCFIKHECYSNDLHHPSVMFSKLEEPFGPKRLCDRIINFVNAFLVQWLFKFIPHSTYTVSG